MGKSRGSALLSVDYDEAGDAADNLRAHRRIMARHA